MSTTKYKIGFEFIEGNKWHWRITEIRNGYYICEDITGKAKHSPLDWVTDEILNQWLAAKLSFRRANHRPCIYCGAKMESYKETFVCTECFRVEEEER